MIDLGETGEPPAVVDLLGAHAPSLVEGWRTRCTSASLVGDGPGVDADELSADRARAVVTVAGPAVIAALAAALQGEVDRPAPNEETTEPNEEPAEPALATVADVLAENHVGVAATVRLFGLLRAVLHEHLSAHCPADVLAVSALRVHGALDDLVGVCVARAEQRLEEAAFVDPLTGLLNRRAMDRDLSRELAVAERHGRRLSLLIGDVDGLKKINDRQGHNAGDQALCTMAAALRSALREGDSAYRVGGDEFVVLMPEMAADDVTRFVHRVRAGGPPAFGWGAATFPDEVTNRPSLLDLADRRLLSNRLLDRAPAGGGVASAGGDSSSPATVAPRPRRYRSVRPALVATFLAGMLLGGGGLASATTGSLPGPLQGIAHEVLGTVGIDVPGGAATRARGPLPPDGEAPDGAPGPRRGSPGAGRAPAPGGPEGADKADDRPAPGAPGAARRPAEPGRPAGAGKPADTPPPAGPPKPADPGRPVGTTLPADERRPDTVPAPDAPDTPDGDGGRPAPSGEGPGRTGRTATQPGSRPAGPSTTQAPTTEASVARPAEVAEVPPSRPGSPDSGGDVGGDGAGTGGARSASEAGPPQA